MILHKKWSGGMVTAMMVAALIFSGVAASYQGYAQQPRQTKDSLVILENEYAEFIKDGERSIHKLVHGVKVRHGSDTLFCDSAFFYMDNNSVEAFGDVRVMQADGTIAFADYMRYMGNTKIAYMRGNASVSSGQDNLWSEEIEYNLGTKTGRYRKEGTLQTATTLVSSDEAEYNTQTKDARFRKNVVVEDVDYHATSTDLGYNTETGMVTFFGPSEIINQQSVMHTSSGTYDSKNRIGHFYDRPDVSDQGYYVIADSLHYNKNTGLAVAIGHVISIDSANNRRLFSDYGQYNEITDRFWAFGNPIMKMVKDNDSFFFRAELFFGEPEENYIKRKLSAQDSLRATLDELKDAAKAGLLVDSSILEMVDSNGKLLVDTTLDVALTDTAVKDMERIQERAEHIQNAASVDSVVLQDGTKVARKGRAELMPDSMVSRPPGTDTSKPKYFIAYHHVVIYSDSMQGRCDSLSYFQSDSLLRMFYSPVLWSGTRQISGDTIYSKMDSSSIKEVYVPRNGIVIARSGPEKANLYDQIQGNKMWAYFSNNQVDSVLAVPNAETIYFATDEDSAYIGVSKVTSEKVIIYFDSVDGGQQIKKIRYEKNIESALTPMQDVVPAQFRLSRFKWQDDRRIKSLEAFYEEDYTASLTDTTLIRFIDDYQRPMGADLHADTMIKDTTDTEVMQPVIPSVSPGRQLRKKERETIPTFSELLQRNKTAEKFPADTMKREAGTLKKED